jgi:hypothetical protein
MLVHSGLHTHVEDSFALATTISHVEVAVGALIWCPALALETAVVGGMALVPNYLNIGTVQHMMLLAMPLMQG